MHVETGRHVYGGARQVLFLLEGLKAKGVDNTLICDEQASIEKLANDFAQVLPTKISGDTDISFIGRLRKHIQEQKPDLIHLHSRRGADWLGGIAAKLERTPAILSRRVDNSESKLVTAIKYRLFSKTIAISEGIGRVLLDQGLPENKLNIVRSAVKIEDYNKDWDREAFNKEFNIREESLTIGVVAQLIQRKGHRYLLECLPDLLKKYPQIQVIFFGQGPIEEQLKREALQLNHPEKILFAGFRADLTDWLGCLDIVAHPADTEGLGVSLLQAGAASVPMVASRTGGIPEIVNGATGILIEPGNIRELEAALDSLLSDKALRQSLGKAAREHVEKYFSIDSMIDGNLSVYNSVLNPTV